jgi:glyoxylase-like metal-dependent hydrolase (beta-lactamase superfamily II)
MFYLARTDSGVIAIDLGWWGAPRALARGLARLHAGAGDVRYVFLTHAHRDHTYGWRLVRGARFVLGAGEVPFFTGKARYRGFLPRIGDWLVTYPHPDSGEVTITALGGDSVFVLGRDTLFTFAVPGHTAGSTAYLFREILFGGDAINWRPWSGFQGARPEFSDDVRRSRSSMRALWQRLDTSRVHVACSAHAKCGVVDSAFRRATAR